MDPTKEFESFLKLPPELQTMIWRHYWYRSLGYLQRLWSLGSMYQSSFDPQTGRVADATERTLRQDLGSVCLHKVKGLLPRDYTYEQLQFGRSIIHVDFNRDRFYFSARFFWACVDPTTHIIVDMFAIKDLAASGWNEYGAIIRKFPSLRTLTVSSSIPYFCLNATRARIPPAITNGYRFVDFADFRRYHGSIKAHEEVQGDGFTKLCSTMRELPRNTWHLWQLREALGDKVQILHQVNLDRRAD
ncbi:uncharacterized protein BCR38DRAFT_471636 [Pseudomassariella vexata]|uniref:Uncharacterized protein n=1 Tax=Pseudomassariella vexata TaxID=1141098 RepID=A0A1Y2EGD5_9PEZI|nr:uncharacterized protein BCR38DRAFT_471636 [Pseudomassariella vexata]ORY70316.1 hypothetical protein BCR38DRAFT_471636 [Pseudomassariella vexata]